MNSILIVNGKAFSGAPSTQVLVVPVIKILPGMVSPLDRDRDEFELTL